MTNNNQPGQIVDPTKHEFYGRIEKDLPPKFSHPHPRVTICTLRIPTAPWSKVPNAQVKEFVGVAICSEEDTAKNLQNHRIGRQVALYKALEKYSRWVQKRRKERDDDRKQSDK